MIQSIFKTLQRSKDDYDIKKIVILTYDKKLK
jgi:hypothetical protein